MKKRAVIVAMVIVVIIVISIISFGEIMRYNKIKELCREIKEGVAIQTTISNATTAPLFLNKFFTITSLDEVLIPLVEACRYGNISAIRTLLENGADPNFSIKGYWTAVEALAFSNLSYSEQNEMLELLYEHGADINGFSSYKPVIFIYAEREVRNAPDFERERLILWLLDHDAVRKLDFAEDSILHYVARGGNANLLEQLIVDFHFDVNQIGYQKQTPLIGAVFFHNNNISAEQQLKIILTLLKYGADKTIKDATGKTAYDYAIENGYSDIAELVRP